MGPVSTSADEVRQRRSRRRIPPEKKADAVIRVLRGESPDQVAAELAVSLHRLERWESKFMSGGAAALVRPPSGFLVKLRKASPWLAAFFFATTLAMALLRFFPV